jgi:phage-related protein
MSDPRWVFYETPAGGTPVSDAIRSSFPGRTGKHGRTRLGGLLDRIAQGKTLPRDVTDLGGGLAEARMTLNGNQYRLFFARCQDGLLGLHFIQKKANRETRHVKLARERLARYDEGV